MERIWAILRPHFFWESVLKFKLIALSLALVSSLAHADLAEDHAKNCQTSEVKSLAGKTGSCRVVIAPKKIETQGFCVGKLMGALPCGVTFIAIKEGAFVNLTCGTNPDAPSINEDMMAEAIGYNVATLISKENSRDVVLNDSNEYALISNRLIDIRLTQSNVNGITNKTATIGISLQAGVVQLQNVTCN